MVDKKRNTPSGGISISSYTEIDLQELARRLAVLDGNGIDKTGGMVGRLEATVASQGEFITSVRSVVLQLKGAIWALVAVALILGLGNGALLLKVLDKMK